LDEDSSGASAGYSKIEKVVLAVYSAESINPEVLEKLCPEADYFERNAERTR
jgi:hypothetical protein